MAPASTQSHPEVELSERQQMVLRALVAAYVAEAAPVGSGALTHLLPVPISSASVRNTMTELHDLALIEKPHSSSGRVPSDAGMRLFVENLLEVRELAAYERRSLSQPLEDVDAATAMRLASELLTEHTRQLGFVVMPRLERVPLQHLSLVRASSERVLVVLVSRSGQAHRRVIEYPGRHDQAELDRIAAELNARVVGQTLRQIRDRMREELAALHDRAHSLLARALLLGLRAFAAQADGPVDVMLGTRLPLLDQPEFRDPERLRDLLRAIERGEQLVGLLDRVLEGARSAARSGAGVSVALGGELDEPGLRHCALVAAHYGGAQGQLEASGQGVLGVIGPSRMDYRSVIPTVDYCSQLVSAKLDRGDGEGVSAP